MVSILTQELNRYSTQQRRSIYEQLYAIELTDGCSGGCGFCGFDAPRFTGLTIEQPDVVRIADEMVELTDRTSERRNQFRLPNRPNRLCLYDATDPLDADNYFEALDLFESKGFDLVTSTAIPEGKEQMAIENLDRIQRISISHMNRDRLKPYFEQLGVYIYIDLYHYYCLKYGRDVFDKSPIRGGQIRVDNTVEETIAQLRETDPSLPTKTRFYDLRKDDNRKHEDVQDPDTLVLWCANKDWPPRSGRIVDRDEDGVENYGRAFDFMPYPHEPCYPVKPFSNVSGVKITPKGVFNVLSVKRSEECKTGRVVEKVDPENFHIIGRNLDDKVLNTVRIPSWKYVRLEVA